MAELPSPQGLPQDLILWRDTLINDIAELDREKAMTELAYRAGKGKLSDLECEVGFIANAAQRFGLRGPTPRFHSALKAALKDIQDMRTQVANALVDLDRTIGELERQLSNLFIRGNFVRFPDEIFGMIFEFAGFGDLKSAINISRVCRRFRNIALSTPLLWSHIRLRGHWIEEAKARADRSSSSTPGLSLVIDARSVHHPRETVHAPSVDYTIVILDFVREYALRITSLEMDLEYLYHSFHDDHSSWSEYSTISLPFLVSMKLSAFCSEFSDTDAFAQREEVWQEYRNWNMPMLRTLHSVNMFPDLPANVLSKIKTYRLEIRKEYDDSYLHWTLSSLAGYLSQMTSIEDLTISSLNLMDEHFPPEDIPKLEMISLRHLSLKFSDYRKTNFKHFFDAFESSSLLSLSINVPSKCIPDLEQSSRDLWNVRRFPKLTDVRFVIRPLFNVGELRLDPRLTILDRFLAEFPKLQDIYFECVSDESHPFSFSNSLCAMQYKNCNLMGRWDHRWWITVCESTYRETHGEELDRCLILDGADPGMCRRTPMIEKTANSIRVMLHLVPIETVEKFTLKTFPYKNMDDWRDAFVE